MDNPTSGAALLDEVEGVFRKFTIQQNDDSYAALALYVAYTHGMDCFDYAPRLVITSAEKRSGKTITLTVIQALVAAPLITANATTAAIFRSLSQGPRTICFDEVDTIFGTKTKADQHEDLRGMLNAGFRHGTPVLRTVGPNHEVQEFPVFAPAVLCAIGTLPDTVSDRAVNIRLRRRKSNETVSDYRIRRDEAEIHKIRDKLSTWAAGQRSHFFNTIPATPLQDRAADVWEPLLSVADAAGGTWPQRARRAAVNLTKAAAEADSDESPGLQLLSDIREVTQNHRSDTIQSTHLISLLQGMEDSRWNENGGLNGRRLVTMLKPYEIHPKRMPSGNGRGYRMDTLRDAFSRYLPAPAPEVTEVTG